jgi:putative ABC transport system permease protein
MFDLDKWGEIWQTLTRHKLRTALTAFGVFWGIFMLVVLVGSGNGLRNGVMEGFGGIATNSFFVWGQKTTKPYGGLQPGRFIRFRNSDTEAIRKEVAEVKDLAPSIQIGPVKTSRGIKNGTFNLDGEYPDRFRIENKPLRKGRFINEVDITESRRVVLIGERVADMLFGKDENPIGQYIDIRGGFFQVVGVFGTRNKGENGANELNAMYLPFTTAQAVFNIQDRIDFYAVTAQNGVNASVAEAKMKALLMARHRVNPEDKVAVGSFNLEMQYNRLQGLFAGINIFLWIVGIGTLVAGIVGVSNIMLIVVQERTKEIGIRKAIGATPWSVISLILQESVVLTAVSGYTGLVCGVALTEGISYMLESNGGSDFLLNPTIDFNVAVAATTLLVICGGLAGVIPATRAAAIQPIEALRAD